MSRTSAVRPKKYDGSLANGCSLTKDGPDQRSGPLMLGGRIDFGHFSTSGLPDHDILHPLLEFVHKRLAVTIPLVGSRSKWIFANELAQAWAFCIVDDNGM